jgi:excisionase family DNA binding protein
MKTKNLSIKELAAFIGVSTDTIRRAVRTGELPATRVGIAYRFDLRQVRRQMERNAVVHLRRGSVRATAGGSRRRAQQNRPRSVKRGRNFQSDLRRRS